MLPRLKCVPALKEYKILQNTKEKIFKNLSKIRAKFERESFKKVEEILKVKFKDSKLEWITADWQQRLRTGINFHTSFTILQSLLII